MLLQLLPSQLYKQCKLTVRHILRASKDNNIRSLYVETHNSNINSNEIIEESRSEGALTPKPCMNVLREKLEIENWDKFMDLKKQNILVKFITEIAVRRVLDCGIKWQNLFLKTYSVL